MSGVEENLAGYLSSMVPNDTQPEEKDKTIALSEYASLISRGTAPKYVDYSEIKVIGQRCIRSDGFDPTQAKFHDPAALVGTLSAVPGDVLVNSTGTGTLGRCSIFYESDCWIVDGHVTVVRPNIAKSHPKFISSIINSPCFQRHIDRFCVAGSTNQIELIREPFSNAQIPFRTVEEQSQIAVVLEAIDAAIEKSEALNAKLKQVRAGMLHDLLTCGVDENGEIRDLILHASDFKESQLGMLPKRWELKPCGCVCREIVVGIVIQPTQYYRESGIPILRSANIREDGIILDDLKFMSEEDHATMKKSAVSPGDLVTIRTGYPGMTAVIPQHLTTANCVDVIISRVGDCLIPEFLALWINSDFGRGQVLQNQGGLAQQHFNVGEMKALLVAIPPVDEQTRIVDYFKSLTDEFEREKESLNKLLLLKQGLSADLLTGQVRVPPDLELI